MGNLRVTVTRTSEFFWNTFIKKRTPELELRCSPIKPKPDDKRTEKPDKDELNDKNLRPRKLWPLLWVKSNFVVRTEFFCFEKKGLDNFFRNLRSFIKKIIQKTPLFKVSHSLHCPFDLFIDEIKI